MWRILRERCYHFGSLIGVSPRRRMMTTGDQRPMPPEDGLVPTDPESEACYGHLVECVRSELQARVAFGDDPRTSEGQQILADLIADVVLDRFSLRPRSERRYHR